MARAQTRRCVKVAPSTHDRLKSYCDAHGFSMSGLVESLLARRPETRTVHVAADGCACADCVAERAGI